MRWTKRIAASALALALTGAVGRPATAEELYALNQHVATIGFSVGHLGLFPSHGDFRRFTGSLALDRAHPERSRIAVDVDARSIRTEWQDAAAKLRSPAYFDVRDYPDVRFASTSITPDGVDKYTIHGRIEIRGVTQPLTLMATLIGRPLAGGPGARTADFVVTGHLKRSAFGMVADKLFTSDTVNITIDARIELGRPGGAG
ncbi:MAG: YceI family protein [Acetobacteraceae bacterium]